MTLRLRRYEHLETRVKSPAPVSILEDGTLQRPRKHKQRRDFPAPPPDAIVANAAQEPALGSCRMSHQHPQLHQLRRRWLIEAALLLQAPILAFWLMKFSPFNQSPGWLDPFIYTGYIHNFKDLWDRYGITYYSVRFGLILPGRALVALFGAEDGFLVLRYLLTLVAGIPLYAVVKRYFGLPLAAVTYIVMVTSPYFARTLMWDYPDATGMPFLCAAMCLILLECRRLWLWDSVAGGCAAMALNSNFFIVAPLGVFLCLYTLLWLIWQRGVARIVMRAICFLTGLIVITGLGICYYWITVGTWDIFSPTIHMSRWLAQRGMKLWRTPGFAWLGKQYGVFIPAILSLFALLCWRWRRPAFHEASLWWSASGIGYFFYVHQFAFQANTLELFYYFSYALPAIFLLLAMTMNGVVGRLSLPGRWWSAASVAAGAITPWLLYSYGYLTAAADSLGTFIALVAVAAVMLPLATYWRGSARLGLAVTASLALGLMFAASFATLWYTSAIRAHRQPNNKEEDVYRTALQFMKAIPPWQARPGHLRFWYSNDPIGYAMQSIQATYLWVHSKLQGDDPGLPYLGEAQLKLLRAPELKWLVMMSETEEQLQLGLDALTREHVAYRPVSRQTIVSGSYRLFVQQLELTGHGGQDGPAAP
jgi:hypothetical protein